MAAERDEIMTMDELVEYLKISKSTLDKLAVENKFPGQRIGKRWRSREDGIDEWLKQHPVRSVSEPLDERLDAILISRPHILRET